MRMGDEPEESRIPASPDILRHIELWSHIASSGHGDRQDLHEPVGSVEHVGGGLFRKRL